jgi:hypothetical protein
MIKVQTYNDQLIQVPGKALTLKAYHAAQCGSSE